MASKKRLIDPHDLWSDIMMLPHNGDMISSEEVEQAIMDAPTVDAVEVVRCRDCRFCKKYSEKHSKRDFLICDRPRMDLREVRADDFCSYGERKDNER